MASRTHSILLKSTSVLALALVLGLATGSAAFADYDYNPFNENEGAYISGNIGWNETTGSSFDDDASYSLATGYQFSTNIRTELEGGYRNADFSGGGDSDVWTLMVNGYYDFKNDTLFTPYLGAGIGWAHSRLDGPGFSNNENAVAYQVGGGVSYALTQNVALTADYRWFDTADFDHTGAGGADISSDYSSHEVRAGMRYVF